MKFAFATVVQLGYSCIEEIYRQGGHIDLLITLDNNISKNQSGRIYLDSFSRQHNIDLLKITNINDSKVIHALKQHNIDYLFIVGWSQIAYAEVLNTPNIGCIGIHPTLLPKGRGRAAIPWAILKGLSKTGVTMFKIDEGVDTGDIIGQIEIPIPPKMTATKLYKLVNEAHVNLFSHYWTSIFNDELNLIPQDNRLATYWNKRTPQDGEIADTMSISEADKLIRATTHPYPGAFYKDYSKKIIYRIWSADPDLNSGDITLSDGYLKLIDYDIEKL